MNGTQDLSEHKRKVFFQQLSLNTTKDSLNAYLSDFQIESCSVPRNEQGQCKGHAIVICCKESTIDSLMARRPHRIDGQIVEIYRSVPGVGPMKENKGITTLVVSGCPNGSINELDLKNVFCGYGNIIKINRDDQNYYIEFDDYDSVDKILLDGKHRVKNIDVTVKKSDRNSQNRCSLRFTKTPVASNANVNSILKKPISKQVTISSQVSCLDIPPKIFCIHITNLPDHVDAEILSKKFNYPIYEILMKVESPVECWLKRQDDRVLLDEFAQRWNSQTILGLKIECQVEEDQPEYCDKFRVGECSKNDGECDWKHILCTANGTCSKHCPFGHQQREKSKSFTIKNRNTTYRIKITGFKHKLTLESLARMLKIEQKYCHINQRDDLVGYVLKINTIKYAQRLMTNWLKNKRNDDNSKLKYQLELDTRSNNSASRWGSAHSVNNEENGNVRRSDSCQRLYSSQESLSMDKDRSRQNSSVSGDEDEDQITEVDDRKINCEAVTSIGTSNGKNFKRQSTSTQNPALVTISNSHLPIDFPPNQWEKLNKPFGNAEKVLFIRGQFDRKRSAVLKVYKNLTKEDCFTEFDALSQLKGIEGVVQLIEPENESNNFHQDREPFWIIMERTPGYSSREFLDRFYKEGFALFDALVLIQKLILIVKNIHSQAILHRNLEPENVLIDWDFKQKPIEDAKLTLINFSRASIESNKTQFVEPQRRYQPQQSNHSTSTNDVSGICDIFFWFLTGNDSQQPYPHIQPESVDKIHKKVDAALDTGNLMGKRSLVKEQLKLYLMNTFNRAFIHPDYRSWTIEQLKTRFEAIQELLLFRHLDTNSTDVIFHEFLSTWNFSSPSPPQMTIIHPDVFHKAADAFSKAKMHFMEIHPNQYSWSDEHCTWIENEDSTINERRHDDILTFRSFNKLAINRCSVLITCFATLSQHEKIITLEIGSSINGKIIRIPVGQFTTNQDFTDRIQNGFDSAINSLIIAITKIKQSH